jgi:hypothetical protein
MAVALIMSASKFLPRLRMATDAAVEGAGDSSALNRP